MLRESSNISSYVKRNNIHNVFSSHLDNVGNIIGFKIELRDSCTYTSLLLRLNIYNDNLCLTINTNALVSAVGNSNDYIKIYGSWYVKFIKLIGLASNLFDKYDYITFYPVKRNFFESHSDSASTLTFVLTKDGWLSYSQSSNGNLVGEPIYIEKILIPSTVSGFQDLIEQKKLSYKFIKNSLSYYNSFIIIMGGEFYMLRKASKHIYNPFKITYLGFIAVNPAVDKQNVHIKSMLEDSIEYYDAVLICGSDYNPDEYENEYKKLSLLGRVCNHPISTHILPVGSEGKIHTIINDTDFNDISKCCVMYAVDIHKKSIVAFVTKLTAGNVTTDTSKNAIIFYGLGEKKLSLFTHILSPLKTHGR